MVETPELVFEAGVSFALEGDLLVPNDDPDVTRTLASIALRTYQEGVLQPNGGREWLPDWSPFAATVTVVPINEDYVRLESMNLRDLHPYTTAVTDNLDIYLTDDGQSGSRLHVDLTQITPRPSSVNPLHTEEFRQLARRQVTTAANTFFERRTYQL